MILLFYILPFLFLAFSVPIMVVYLDSLPKLAPRQQRRRLVGYLAYFLLGNLYFTLLSILDLYFFWAPWMVLYLLLTLFSIFILAVRWGEIKEAAPNPAARQLYSFGAILMIILQLTPWLTTYGIYRGCAALRERKAAQLIVAVEAYHQERGNYPADLAALTPEYVERVTTPVCSTIIDYAYDWPEMDLQQCRNGQTILRMLHGQARRYDFESGEWVEVLY